MSAERRPLILRLRNWVGDVVLGLPTLRRLDDAGYALQLIGKGWARDLLAGHGWAVSALPGTMRERVALLRRLRRDARAADRGFDDRLNALCFPFSFSSALEFRLAGLHAIGHASEARGALLGRRVARPRGLHELAVYWQLGSALLGTDAPLPAAIGLRPSPVHRAQALAIRERHAIGDGYIVVCPFAGGTFEGHDKTWPAFAEFVARALPSFGRTVVCCPGPGEEAEALARYGAATVVPGVGLGAYAALLADAALMVSNDTGPGHIAAAVGTPLLSVLGPTEPAQWGAWGPTVTFLRHWPRWPTVEEAARAAERVLDRARSTPGHP